MPESSGILLIDKPEGPTSRQVAEAIGKLLLPRQPYAAGGRRFRVGHAGTLDPLATGLLLILAGRGTRLAPFLQKLDKRYLATVRFGTATDTLDREGEVTARAPVPPQPAGLDVALAGLLGTILQVPPVISSIKQGGKSLHRLARAGRDVQPPAARRVHIERCEAIAVRWGEAAAASPGGQVAPDGLLYEVVLDIACGSGTYVRALARDLAAALGTVGHVHALRRLAVGPFQVDDAVTPAVLALAADPRARLVPLKDALPHLPVFALTPTQADRVRHGAQPEIDWLPAPVPAAFGLVDQAGDLVAIGRCDSENGRPVTAAVFPGGTAAASAAPAQTEADPCG